MPKNISRLIFYYFSCCMTIFLLFLAGENLRSFLFQNRVLGAEINTQVRIDNELLQEKENWENFVSQNPSYLPGYIELVNINLELGDRNSAIINLIKARQINPNSEEVISLEEVLGF